VPGLQPLNKSEPPSTPDPTSGRPPTEGNIGTHKVSLFSGAYDGSVQKTSYSITVK
jgi:hypothetical protein